jgi:hypothetical protein
MKENTMTSTSILAKLGAAAAAVAAPAMLFLGAGNAQAFGIQIPLAVWGTSAPAGVDVHIQTPGDGLSGWCTYSSFVRGNPFGKPLPAINVPFYLRGTALVPRLADRFDLGHHRQLPQRHHDGPVGLVTTRQMSNGVDDPVPAADVRRYRIDSTAVHADQAYDSGETGDRPRGLSS